jgi:CBS domain-containing protein
MGETKMMTVDEPLGILRKTPPFDRLDPEDVLPVCDRMRVHRFDPGEYIFRQGEPSRDCLFIIVRGLVEILVEDERHVESVVGIRRPHDFFGETVVLSGQRYPGSARAREALICLCLFRGDLESLIYNHPEFSGFFNTLLAERMRLLYERNLADRSGRIPVAGTTLLFRDQVSRVMSTPLLTCREDESATRAARTMMRRNVGSLVVLDAGGRYRGILTDRHLVHGLVAEPICAVDECTAGRLMDTRLVAVSPEAYLGEALVTMIRNRTRHLVVVEREAPVGIVAFSDLIRSQSADSLMLIYDIADQTDIAGLARLSSGIDRVLDALVAEQAGVRETMEIMCRLNDRITRKVIELSESQMKVDGWGAPPVDYCWVNMGSAARYEQTLRTDQDNAIIYADPKAATGEAVARYFLQLAGRVVDGLERCGFERCSGGVMASNPQWCRSISRWLGGVGQWMTSTEPEDIRVLTILLDFRPLWGHAGLAETLREGSVTAFSDSDSAGHMLSRDDRKLIAPIGLLGNIATERSGPQKGRLNLKTAGLVHMVNAVRLLAVNQGISAVSTLDRLDRLADDRFLSAEDADFYKAGYETLMGFRIRENLRRVRAGQAPDNTIDPKRLNKRETLLLKDALSAVTHLQKRINKDYRVPWMDYFGH